MKVEVSGSPPETQAVTRGQGSKECVSGVSVVSDKLSFVGQIEIQGYATFFKFVHMVRQFVKLSDELAILAIVPGLVNVLTTGYLILLQVTTCY